MTEYDADGYDKAGLHQVHNAAKQGDLDKVRAQLDQGVPVDIQDKTHHGRTALQWASIEQRYTAMKELIERKANLNQVDKDGGTALMFAASKNNVIIQNAC